MVSVHAIVRTAFYATLGIALLTVPSQTSAHSLRVGLSEIGTLGGFVGSSSGSAINKRGWVVGRTDTADGTQQAFLWKERNGMLLLGHLGGTSSEATDINDDLQVVGNSFTADGQLQAFLWTEGAGMTALPLSATSSQAAALNEVGDVAGTLSHEDGVQHAYLWTAGQGVRDLGTFNGSPTTGTDVNDQDEIIGSYIAGEVSRAFYWSLATGFRDLGTLGGPGPTIARMINNKGHVVGTTTDVLGRFRAFRWTLSGGMTDLGDLGAGNSSAAGVSRHGNVVGTSDGRAFLWTSAGGMVDLGTLGGTLSEAEGISPDGTVVTGWSHLASGHMHAFRWTAALGLVDLGAVATGSTFGSRVNNNGRVFGGGLAPAGYSRAYIWDADGMTDVGTFTGQASETASLSDAGHVVGQSPTPGGFLHAFLWTNSGGMRDLGDLGGGYSQAVIVNAAGNVAGQSTTADGSEHGFFWSAATGMIDLGSFDGAQVTVSGMNAQSVVVGMLSYKEATPRSRGYRWTQTGVEILQPLPGAAECHAAAVNAQGRVLGASTDTDNGVKAVVWEPGQTTPVIVLDPTVLGGLEAQGTYLSDSGWMAGYVQLNTDLGFSTRRGWVRDPAGNVRLLDDAGPGSGQRSLVLSLNEAGDAAGSVIGEDIVERPALWKAQDISPTGTRGLTLIAGAQAIGQATSVNGTGKAAGFVETTAQGTEVFLWKPVGGLQILGSLGGFSVGAVKLNGADQIAGTDTTAAGYSRAFVWKRATFQN